MKLLSIKFKNLLSFGNQFTTIDFQESEKVLVCAVNGSGKTTILEAVYFNLTGKPYRSIKVDQLVNSKNKKEMLTIGEYESSTGTKVKITRGRKKNIFEIEIDGVQQDQELSKDFQKKIESILDFTPENLKKTFIISSTSYQPFLSMTPENKRKLIDEVIEIEVFTKMSDSIKKDRTIEKENLKDINYEVDKLKSNLDLINKFNGTDENKKIEELEQQIADNKKQAKEFKIEYDKNQLTFNELTLSTNELIKKDLNQSNAITKLKTQSYKIETEYQTKRNQLENQSQFFNENDFCDRCKREINIEEKEKITWEIEQKILKLDESYSDELKNKIEVFEEKNDQLKEIIKNNQKTIEYISCSLRETHEKRLKLKYAYEGILKEIDGLKTSIRCSKNDSEDLSKQLNEKYEEKIKIASKIDVMEISLKMLGEKYLRSYMIKKYLPVINESLNKYLEIFGFSFKIILDEEFNEQLLSRDYDNLCYNNLSEGEKLRVNMSLLFSFYDISKIKMKPSSNVLFMDEVADMSGDIFFLYGLNQIINNLTHDGLSCIIISHNSDLQNIIEFDKHLELHKVNGFSKIKD